MANDGVVGVECDEVVLVVHIRSLSYHVAQFVFCDCGVPFAGAFALCAFLIPSLDNCGVAPAFCFEVAVVVQGVLGVFFDAHYGAPLCLIKVV